MTNKRITQNELIDLIKQNKGLFQKDFHVIEIGIFGSYARGEQNDNSDIDLVVEFEENTQNIYEHKMALREFFSESFGKDVDIARKKYLKPRIKDQILKEIIYV